jgi:hypothetical protein
MKITKSTIRNIISEYGLAEKDINFDVAMIIKDIMPPDEALSMLDDDFYDLVVGVYEDRLDDTGEGWAPYEEDLESIRDHLTIVDLDENTSSTRHYLKKILKESVLVEQEMIEFVRGGPDPELENKLANFAHAGDIKGALADPDINTEDLDLVLDEFRGNMKYIEHPDFDKQKTKEFIADLEDAWYDATANKDQQELEASPDKHELKAIGGGLNMILARDLEYLVYQPRKRGGVIVALDIEDVEGPQGFPMGNAQTTVSAEQAAQYNTSIMDIMDVLDAGGAKLRKKNKPVKHTPPMYD